jgi:hypothetical protein
MKITIKKNRELDLKMPKFHSDTILNKDMPEHFSSINKFSFICIIGKPLQGKTSLMTSFFNTKKIYKKVFNHILLVAPESSLKNVKENIFTKHLPEENIYHELDTGTLLDIKSRLEGYSNDKQKSCLILDDVSKDLKFVENDLKGIIYNRRHLKVNIILLVQSVKNLSLSLRKVIDVAILFKPNKMEFQTMMEEQLELNKHEALQLLELYKKEHDYLMFDVYNSKIFLNQDEVILEK